MEYSVGRTGRVIAARLFEGEDIYQRIEQIACDENIRSAAVLIIGGVRQASVVVGPKTEEPKIVGNFKDFAGPGEVMGVGTIYCDNNEPKLHLHAAMGRDEEIIVGCPRGGASTFLTLEVTIIEIEGIKGGRKPDRDTGLSLLRFE
ncbi:MAG: PPC domain-containing DNA-binding protein [Planctomycetota bacterium]|jgi:predicted DNA-binding protein with PD1-like motif